MKRLFVATAAIALAACNSQTDRLSDEQVSEATIDDTTAADGATDAASDDLVDADPPVSSAGYSSYGGYSSDDEEFDEDAAREEAEEEVSSDTYTGIGSPYGCTSDCSGHEAGFAYQARRGYDTTVGSSDSLSFDEGRRAYDEAVDERVEEMRAEREADNDY